MKMKTSHFIASLSLVGAVAAVEMTRYAAAAGVEPGFASYLKEYAQTFLTRDAQSFGQFGR